MADNRPGVYRDGTTVVYRASVLGECVNALLAMYDGIAPRRKKEMTELLELTAEEGELHEAGMIAKMKKDGYKLLGTQEGFEIPVIPDVVVRGHTDARFAGPNPTMTKEILWEGKSKSDKQYDLWERGGWASFPNHAAQVTSYMRAFPDRDLLFAVKRRSDGRITTLWVSANNPPAKWTAIRNKILAVELARRNGTTPACDLEGTRKYFCPFWFLHAEKEYEDLDLTDDMRFIVDELLEKRWPVKAIEKEGKDAEVERKLIDVQLMNMLGDADKLETDKWVVTKTGSSSSRWEEDGLREEFGDAVMKYKKNTRYDYLMVKERKVKK